MLEETTAFPTISLSLSSVGISVQIFMLRLAILLVLVRLLTKFELSPRIANMSETKMSNLKLNRYIFTSKKTFELFSLQNVLYFLKRQKVYPVFFQIH